MNITTWFSSLLLTLTLLVSSLSGMFTGAPAKTAALTEKAGGYITGVCHPNEDYDRLAELGVGWVRFDIPYPYNADGSISGSYTSFKNRCKGYADRGVRVMAITPYRRV